MSSPSSLAEQLRDARISLRDDLQVTRQILNGRATYVLRDGISFQSHSLSASDYEIVLAMRSGRTAGEAFQELVNRGTLGADREGEFYQFVVGLHQRGLLQLPMEDSERLYARLMRGRQGSMARTLLQLVSFKIRLGNPDSWLDEIAPKARFLFHPVFVALWAVGMLVALGAIVADWDRFQQPWEAFLATRNVALILVLMVILKAWHEIGHALACKVFGGVVPEWGALLIVGTPCAYVDTTAAWGFHKRFQRVVVNLGGMYFESMAAMVGTFVWLSTEPGLVHSAAHQTIVVSTIVTLLFNLNPLMKFDGYYVLSDCLGIPNLKQISDRAAIQEIKHRFLGLPIQREKFSGLAWGGLVAFGIAAACYKVIVVTGLFSVIAYRLPALGLMAGGAYVAAMIVPALIGVTRYLWVSEETAPLRGRALVCWVALFALPTSVLLVPWRSTVAVGGVVRAERTWVVRAASDGYLVEINVSPGDRVLQDQLLGKLENEECLLEERRTAVATERAELSMRRMVMTEKPQIHESALRSTVARHQWRDAQDRAASLAVRSPAEAIVTRAPATDQSGRFHRVGEPLIELGSGGWRIKTLLSAEQVADAVLVPGRDIDVVFEGTGATATGRLQAVLDFGGQPLSLVELTHLAGGDIVVNEQTMVPTQPYYEVTIDLDAWPIGTDRAGVRVDVLVPVRAMPLGWIGYRRWLQFLDRYARR